jgi:hypothetical protein
MEAICSSETSINFQRTTWYYIPENSTLHNHSCETSNPIFLVLTEILRVILNVGAETRLGRKQNIRYFCSIENKAGMC